MLINFVFFLNHCFHFVIYPRRFPIVKDFGLMGNKICHNIKNSFIENRDLLINTLVRKSSFSVEVFNWGVFNWVVFNRGCWLFILRKLRQFPQNSFFILFFSLASNGCWLVILRKLGHFLKKKVIFVLFFFGNFKALTSVLQFCLKTTLSQMLKKY